MVSNPCAHICGVIGITVELQVPLLDTLVVQHVCKVGVM